MRTADCIVGRARARCKMLYRRLRLVRACSTLEHELRVLRELRAAEKDASAQTMRTMHIMTACFNINTYSEEQCLILILHLYDLVEGRQPDAYLYRQSGIDEELRHHIVVYGKQYYLYADKEYVLRP
eukprot:IDg1537t1